MYHNHYGLHSRCTMGTKKQKHFITSMQHIVLRQTFVNISKKKGPRYKRRLSDPQMLAMMNKE